jgi:hypothetical protein
MDDPIFTARIESYLSARRAAVREVGRVEETADPVELQEDVVELREHIQARRQSAREGDIFGGSVGEEIRSSLRERLSRKDGPRIIAEIMDVQPKPFSLMVNTQYPADQPHSTMPGPTLRLLPRLPKQLTYRFVGRTLVLLDSNTGLIVDVLPEAIPQV